VHEADTLEEVVVFAATRPARLITSVAEHVPPQVARVIDRALAFEKDDRWPDARSMQEALARAYSEAFGEPLTAAVALRSVAEAKGVPAAVVNTAGAISIESPPVSGREKGTPVRARALWLGLAAVVVVCASGLAVFVGVKRPTRGPEAGQAATSPSGAATARADLPPTAAVAGETPSAMASGSEASPSAATSVPKPVMYPVAPSAQSKPSPASAHPSPARRPPLVSGRSPAAASEGPARPPAPTSEGPAPEHDIFKP
jgi:serine/threonine-protein kinase